MSEVSESIDGLSVDVSNLGNIINDASRESVAALAMHAIIVASQGDEYPEPERVAKRAVSYANALFAELQKK